LFSTWIFNCTNAVVAAAIVGLPLFVVRFTG
jgi:ABC-type molybdate transport system permease subunit